MNSIICPNCGQRGATEKHVAEYAYKECGLPGVRLFGGVTETSCPHCGENSVRVQKEGQLLQVIALMLLTTPHALSGSEMKFLRKSCGLSQAALADQLKKRRETVAEREAKKDPNLSEAEEAWFRLIILHSFDALLGRPGRNHLSAVHVELLGTFKREIGEKMIELGERELKRLTLRLKQSGNNWHSMDRAA
jgi:DNA-binding transcriptional regulator YiaG